MKTFAVDFETYYDKDYSITTLGIINYVEDPRFNAYMVSIVGTDGTKFVGDPKDAPWQRMDGHVWVSHNAAFDEAVYRRLLRENVSDAWPCEWHCTASMSCYFQGPRSLAGASKQFLGKFVDKGIRSAQAGRVADIEELNSDPALVNYALQDSRLCLDLWNLLSKDWPEDERVISRLSYTWGYDGLSVDIDGAWDDHEKLKKLQVEAKNSIPWSTEYPPLSPKQAKLQAERDGIPFPTSLSISNKDTQDWFDEYAKTYAWIGGMRTFRRANMLKTKYETLISRLDERGRFPYGLKYYGAATTGRFSGSDGFNVQNMPRGEILGADLRSRIIPDPGHVFVVADYAQVEVRTLASLAGDISLLDRMREGMNVYEASAMDMLGLSREEVDGLSKKDPDTYAMVKAMVLGCGFGMGWKNFKIVAPIMTGGKYDPTPSEAKRAVNIYRRTHPQVVKLWENLNTSARTMKGGEFNITLPSGRVMRYFDVQTVGNQFTCLVQRGGKRKYFTGAALAENCAQGFARDLLVNAMLRIQEEGLPGRIVLHVHDEIVMSCPKEHKDFVSNRVVEIMEKAPEWAPDLPLGTEVKFMERYEK